MKEKIFNELLIKNKYFKNCINNQNILISNLNNSNLNLENEILNFKYKNNFFNFKNDLINEINFNDQKIIFKNINNKIREQIFIIKLILKK